LNVQSISTPHRPTTSAYLGSACRLLIPRPSPPHGPIPPPPHSPPLSGTPFPPSPPSHPSPPPTTGLPCHQPREQCMVMVTQGSGKGGRGMESRRTLTKEPRTVPGEGSPRSRTPGHPRPCGRTRHALNHPWNMRKRFIKLLGALPVQHSSCTSRWPPRHAWGHITKVDPLRHESKVSACVLKR
jgi:hypothetical protein